MSQRTCDLPGCAKPHRARGLCSTHYNQAHATPEQRHPSVAVPCTVCGATVRRGQPHRRRPTCSVECRTALTGGTIGGGYDWGADAEARARRAGCRVVESFDRLEIFERDKWACALCGAACREPNPHDPASATVDHIVPLSLGGEHSRANAQTACLSCNSAKQDRPTGGWADRPAS